MHVLPTTRCHLAIGPAYRVQSRNTTFPRLREPRAAQRQVAVRCAVGHVSDTADAQRDATHFEKAEELREAALHVKSHVDSGNGLASASQSADQMPLLEAVRERGMARKEAAFHIPGHKRGAGAPEAMLELLGGQTAFQHDLTELPGLDYLASPDGAIKAAQQLAAEACGADATFFLVNGSTVGVEAAVLATCRPGEALIVARNSHLCAFSACVLAGCYPIYAQPEYDARLGVAHGITRESLRREFDRASRTGRRVGAVLIVSPTYFGVCSDIAGLAEICKEKGVPLIVDEAHGPHFGLSEAFPRSALSAGASAVVQSTHKVLSALGQAAMLHIKGPLIPDERVSRALQTLQTSSPSYLLLSSLDAARAQAQRPAAFDEALAAAELARSELLALPYITLLENSLQIGGDGMYALDPLRLAVNVEGLGLSGGQVDQCLADEFGVVAEFHSYKVVVFALGIGTRLSDAEALVAAFRALVKRREDANGSATARVARAAADDVEPIMQIHVRMSPRDAFFAPTERVPVSQAAGRISAELLCPYPPGVPAVFPGELLSQEALTLLDKVISSGGKVTGAADETLQTVLVVEKGHGQHAALPIVPGGPGAELKSNNRWVVEETSMPRRVKQVFTREQKDLFGGWVAVRLIQERGSLEYSKALYADYDQYCRQLRVKPLNERQFLVLFQQRYRKLLPNANRIRMDATTDVIAYGGIKIVEEGGA